jgi:hypothetical protein
MKKNLLILLGLTISLFTNAQVAIPTTGGNASGSGGSISYTIGQVIYTTNTGTNGSVAQGVQQPFEISIVTGIEQAKGINLNCSVYPNPTTDYLTLKVDNIELSALNFQLFDINGRLLVNKKIVGNESTIPMKNLVPATYFLKVIQMMHTSSQEVKTFKIIKN